jgi:ferredoxin
LAEISGILRMQGFTILAAANFIGQHAFASDSIPLAYGRPDQVDLQKASEFGRKVAEKIKTDREDITSMALGRLYIHQYARGFLDAQGSYYPEQYHKDQYVSVSEEARELCGGCMRCEESCPTGAIKAATLQIDDKLCTRCFACTYVCPAGVLRKYLDLSSELASLLRQQVRHRGEPQVFL